MKISKVQWLTTQLAVGVMMAGLIPAIPTMAAEIPSDAATYNGHSYKIYKEDLTWKEAKKACEDLGGHLATITSDAENSFIYSLMSYGANYWIGGTDEEEEGTWKWITGETWSVTHWDEDQPDNSQLNTGADEDYLQYCYSYGANGWNDSANKQDSAAETAYICEWDAAASDTADTTASMTPEMFVGTSWYGENQTPYWINGNLQSYQTKYSSFTFDSCDSNGNFTYSNYVRAYYPKASNPNFYAHYKGTGKLDFTNNTITFDAKINVTDIAYDWNLLDTERKGTFDAEHIYLTNQTTDTRVNDKQTYTTTYSRTSKWASEEVTDANSVGLIPDTLKEKDMTRPITRAEFAAVSVNLYEAISGQTTVAGALPFTDVSGNVNQDYISRAYGIGITAGTSATTFNPNVQITRQDLACMLTRAIKKYKYPEWTFATDSQYILDTSRTEPFADDADISRYAKPSVYYLYANGIISGIGNNKFAPRAVTEIQKAEGYATATREQAIALSLRIYNKKDDLK